MAGEARAVGHPVLREGQGPLSDGHGGHIQSDIQVAMPQDLEEILIVVRAVLELKIGCQLTKCAQ